MAKFCIKCGKPLEEGTECTCSVRKENDTITKTKQIIRNYTNLFLEITKGLVKAPIDTIKKYGVAKNAGFSMVALFLNALIFSLFLYCFLKEGTNLLSYGFPIRSIDVSFLKIVLFGIFQIGIGFVITISMIYGSGSLLKKKVDFKTITSMVGICSIVMTTALIFSFIMLFLSMKLAIFILLVASLFYLVYLCQGIMEVAKIDKNKLAYVFVLTVCVTVFVVVYVVPKILF